MLYISLEVFSVLRHGERQRGAWSLIGEVNFIGRVVEEVEKYFRRGWEIAGYAPDDHQQSVTIPDAV